MKFRTGFQKCLLSQIDIEDTTFRISSPDIGDSLIQSIKAIGLVNPPLLQVRGYGQHRIVVGFRRVDVLRQLGVETIDAFIVQDDIPDRSLFRFAIQLQSSEHTLGPVEISTVIYKLRTMLGVNDDKIVETFLPIMGCGRNPKILQLYGSLYALEPEIQHAIEQDELSVEIAAAIAQAEKSDRLAFFELVKDLHLGKNRQREFFSLLMDIARIENRPMRAILESAEFVRMRTNSNLTPSQKTETIKRELWRRRYPRYSTVAAEFQLIVKKMKLPPQMSLRPPAFFEGEEFHASFAFKTENDFRDRVRTLQRIYDDGIVGQIVNLTI